MVDFTRLPALQFTVNWFNISDKYLHLESKVKPQTPGLLWKYPAKGRQTNERKPSEHCMPSWLLNGGHRGSAFFDYLNFLSYIDFKKHYLVKILHSLNLTQVVNSITRPLSKTCLDHIWCSHPEHLNNISVIPSGMSDHLPIVATRKYNRTRSNNSRYNAISYRDIKNLDKDAFVESLDTALWDCAFVFDDINDIVDAWYKILKAVV